MLVIPKKIPPVYPLDVPNGCVLYYDFQDGGSKIIDHSGRGNHGTSYGTVTNLLGSDGDCESTSGWSASTTYARSLALDSTTKVFGNNSIKLVVTGYGAGSPEYASSPAVANIVDGKYYLVTVYAKTDITPGTPTLRMAVANKDAGNITINSDFTRKAFKFLADSGTAGTQAFKFDIRDISGSDGSFNGWIDGVQINEITQSEYDTLTVDQLMSRYPFHNGSQANIYVGSTPVSAPYGLARKFDGVDDYVEVAHSASLNLSGEMTLEAIINLSQDTNLYRTILAKIGSFSMDIASTDEFTFTVAGIINIRSNTTLINQVNRWYHLLITRQGTSGNWTYKFHINGALDNTITNTSNITTNTNKLRVGANESAGSTSAPFQGNLGLVRIYDRVLSAAEIAQEYKKHAWRFGLAI